MASRRRPPTGPPRSSPRPCRPSRGCPRLAVRGAGARYRRARRPGVFAQVPHPAVVLVGGQKTARRPPQVSGRGAQGQVGRFVRSGNGPARGGESARAATRNHRIREAARRRRRSPRWQDLTEGAGTARKPISTHKFRRLSICQTRTMKAGLALRRSEGSTGGRGFSRSLSRRHGRRA